MSTTNDELLLFDGFDSPELDRWVSYVGGENEDRPSWKAHAGQLVQPIEDGLIRAFLTGEPAWSDYSVQARIQIQSTGAESRAGLVIRDDGRGFYVLRFTRGSNRTQLMYHCRSPFGWHELATVPLDGRADPGAWVSVKVEARGPFVRCFVDGKQYIDVADSRTRCGRVGFYACEAQASFDDFEVRRLAPLAMASSRVSGPPYAPAVSFWFREMFTEPGAGSWVLPPAWTIDTALCIRDGGGGSGPVARLQGAPFSDGHLQVRLRILDGTVQAYQAQLRELLAQEGSPAVTPPQPPPAAPVPVVDPAAGRAGIVLRGRDRSYYAAVLDRAGARVTLIHRDEDQNSEEQLGSVDFKGVPEDRWYTLTVQAKGEAMVVLLDGVPCIAAEDGRHSGGYVGLFADVGPAVFTDFLAASGK